MSENLLADVDQNSYAADHDIDAVKTSETVNMGLVSNNASVIVESTSDVVKGLEYNVTSENPEKKFGNSVSEAVNDPSFSGNRGGERGKYFPAFFFIFM